MKIIILLMLTILMSFGEVRGVVLNKDKLLVPKSKEKIDPKKMLEKKIEAILEKSKQVKELSKRYSKIVLFYKNQLVFHSEKKDFKKEVADKDIRFIIDILRKIEKSIDETKLIVIKDKKKIKKLDEQIWEREKIEVFLLKCF